MIKYNVLMIAILLLCSNGLSTASPKEEPSFDVDSVFQAALGRKTTLLFSDDCQGNWQKKWSKDGLRAKVLNSPQGMYVYAGQQYLDDADHVVLWTKKCFKGNIIIEYDFTRLDTASRNSVNILYIQAQGSGKGAYKKEILKWSALRQIPAMNVYFDHMDAYHISYAVSAGREARETNTDDYIRARRYMPAAGQHLKGTSLRPEYLNSGFFKRGIPYHLTIVKEDKLILFHVKGDGKEKTFYFSAESFPPIVRGRIGLRQMFTRNSLYSNFKVYQLN